MEHVRLETMRRPRTGGPTTRPALPRDPLAFEPPGPQSVLALQRLAGNAAVADLLKRRPVARSPGEATTVQCCGGLPPDRCPCSSDHGERTDRGMPAQPQVQRASGKGRGPDCPGYGRGEVARSHTAEGILTEDTRLLPGFLHLMDFGVDRRSVKSSVKDDPRFKRFVADVNSDPTFQLNILGLDDCVGSVRARELLRHGRAQRVLELFGQDARSRVRFAGAAPANLFTADNRSSGGRAMNRGALIEFNQEVTEPPEVVQGKKPKPPPGPSTSDCSAAKITQLKAAHPLAKAMVDKALGKLDSPSAPVLALMRKYFHDDGLRTRQELVRGLTNIKNRGLDTDVTLECDDDDEILTRCGGSTHGWAIPLLGWRVHLCDLAFKHSTTELASTLIHEMSHLVDGTWKVGELDCQGGCPSGTDRWDLYDNADSYARFAEEAHALP